MTAPRLETIRLLLPAAYQPTRRLPISASAARSLMSLSPVDRCRGRRGSTAGLSMTAMRSMRHSRISRKIGAMRSIRP